MTDSLDAALPMPDSPAPTVLVAGGGPAALGAALGLARRGVRVLHADVRDTSLEDHGAAWILHEATLERLERLGLGGGLERHVDRWETARVLYKGRDVAEAPLERRASTRWHDYAVAGGEALTAALRAAIAREPGVTRVPGTRVLSAAASPGHGVRLVLETTDGTTATIEGDFLVAADGAASTARGSLGVSYPGTDLDERVRFAVVRSEPPFGRERRVVLQPPGGGVGAATPIAADLWEVAWLVDDRSTAAAERGAGRLDRAIAALLEGADHTVVSCGDRPLRDRAAARPRLGPVLFAGAALRSVPALGSWDVNDALEDAESAAFHLALVIRGLAPLTALDRYDAERQAATRRSRERAERVWRFLVPGTWTGLTARNALLSGPFGGRGGRRGTALRLWTPPGLGGADHDGEDPEASRVVGGPAPDGPTVLLPRRTPGRFREIIGPGFSCVAFAGNRAAVQEIGQWTRTCRTAAPLRFFLVVPPEQLLEGGHGAGFDAVLVDEQRRVREGFQVAPNETAVFVIRPDGYVVDRFRNLPGRGCIQRLERLTGCHPEVRDSGIPAHPPAG